MLRWDGEYKTTNGRSTSKESAFSNLLGSKIKYEEFEEELINLNLYAINQALLASYGCGTRKMPEPSPGYLVEWKDGFFTREDLIRFIVKFNLSCRVEFIELTLT